MQEKLSIIINVKNGERYLARCLKALSNFDDVVMLDNYSSDKTLEIAKKFNNVRIFQHEFCGMGKLRNLAASYATNNWILFVDCDEILSPELVGHLLTMKFKSKCLYLIKRQNYYANQHVNSSAWENDWVKRLYNRKECSFSENEVHEGVIDGGVKQIKIKKGFIYHFPYEEVSQLIDKMQFYSTLYAKQYFNKKFPKLYTIPFRSFFTFLKCYILKRGFLDGFEGLTISMYNAIGVFSKYIKLYELYYKKHLAISFVISEIKELDRIIPKINRQRLLPENVFIFIEEDNKSNYREVIPQIQEKLEKELVIPNVVIGEIDQDIGLVVNSYLIDYPSLDYVAHIENNELFQDKSLLKKCKQAILGNKNLPKIQIINNPKG